MKDNYYALIEKKGSRITLLHLYDNTNKTVYCGETKIKRDSYVIESDPLSYFNSSHLLIIPINKFKFNEFLESDYNKFRLKQYKKFIIENNLEEWYI